MSLASWRPCRDRMSIGDAIHRLFNAFTGRGVAKEGTWRSGSWSPAVDIYETNEALILKAELAGFSKEDMNIEIKERALLLRGSRPRESEVDEAHYLCMEWASGAFERSFLLPATIDSEQVTASYKDGVLKLRLPKAGAVNLAHRHQEARSQSS
jgi:HSP20 family protein